MDVNKLAVKILTGFNPDKLETLFYDILDILVKNGLSNFNELAKIALQRFKSFNLFKTLIDLGADNLDELALIAALSLKPAELLLCLDNGARNVDEIARIILSNYITKKIEITYALIRNGINLKDLAVYAALYCNLDILLIIDDIDDLDVNTVIYIAAEKGYTNIFMHFINRFTGDINHAAYQASKNIFCDKIVLKCIQKGATNLNEIAHNAAETGNINVVKMAFENGAYDIGTTGLIAAGNGNLSVVEFSINNGAEDCIEAMILIAKEKDYKRIVDFLTNKILDK